MHDYLFLGEPLIERSGGSAACLCCKVVFTSSVGLEEHLSSASHCASIAAGVAKGSITRRPRFSWGAALGAWWPAASMLPGWSLAPNHSSTRGENGLYGGQLQPVAIFLLCAAAVTCFEWEPGGGSGAAMRGDQLVWGSFVRLFSLAFALAFASLRRQLIGLVGRRGLYPAAALLAQARRADCSDCH